MKKSFGLLIALLFTGSFLLNSCGGTSEKVKDAQQDVIDANEELDEANKEYLLDVEAYREEVAQKIALNNQIIADYNAKIKTDKKMATTAYKEEIAELDRKNAAMKTKMDGYSDTGKSNWEAFKKELGKDMENLGKAFNEFGSRQTK